MYPPYGARPASKKKKKIVICSQIFHVNYNTISEFSASSRNSLENLQIYEIKHIYNTLYTVQHVSTASGIFANVFIIRSWERGFL